MDNNEMLEADQSNLATRWQRFWASIIDSLIMMVLMIPLMFFTGMFEVTDEMAQPSYLYTLGIGLAGLAFFVLINYKLLTTKGQTIGKKVLNTKIVEMDGSLPDSKALLTRYGVFFGLGYIPVIGSIINLVNVLFIFGKEKRCGHDYIAKTKVVKAD